MELKTISFKGVTRTPDNIAAPGDLAIAMNVVNDGAGLEMMEQPEVVFELAEGETFLAIHKGTGYLHYITDILSGTTHTLTSVTIAVGVPTRTPITTTNGAPSVEIIGNTIIYNDADGIHYVLWKDGAYINLGQKPPQTYITFGLNSDMTAYPDSEEPLYFSERPYTDDVALQWWATGNESDGNYVPPKQERDAIIEDLEDNLLPAFNADFVGTYSLENRSAKSDSSKEKTDNYIGLVSNTIMGAVNKLVKDATDDNKFVYPFFVRYAYRLFDGSYIMHSDPVLLVPNSKGPVFALDGKEGLMMTMRNQGGNGEKIISVYRGRAYAFTSTLQYGVTAPSQTELNKWKDIVTGIDVFASAPIATIDQDGKVYGYREMGTIGSNNPWDEYFSYTKMNGTYGSEPLDGYYTKQTFERVFQQRCDSLFTPWGEDRTNYPMPTFTMMLPTIDDNEFKKRLINSSQFYKIAEIPFEDIFDINFGANLRIENLTLSTLTTQPALHDDYFSRDTMSAETMSVYNERLMLANFSRTPHYPLPTAVQWMRNRTNTAHYWQMRVFIHAQDGSDDIILPMEDAESIPMVPIHTFEGFATPYNYATVGKTIATAQNFTLRVYHVWEGMKVSIDMSGQTGYITTAIFVQGDLNASNPGDANHQPTAVVAQGNPVIRVDYSQTPGSGTFTATAPQGANYLLVSVWKDATIDVVYKTELNRYDGATPLYIFYPNPDAYKVELYDGTEYYTLRLSKHPALNGAYWFAGLPPSTPAVTTGLTNADVHPVSFGSELIASNTDNPFSFAPANQDKIGSGRIIALCPAVRPLSEGQFGYANLYVFTTDGVWAMQVSTKDGTFSNIAPVTRDVLSEGCKPLSLDTSVVFQAPRGIMLLTGSKAQCISEAINGDVWRVPNISNTLNAALGSDSISDAVDDLLNTPTSAPALMAYDYTNQRVYVTPLNKAFSWVYNLKSGVWTQSSTHVTSAVNTYPGCVFAEDDNVVELLENNRFDRCAIITRPLCFAPLALQKIRELKGLTVDDGGTWCSVLWATRDWRRYAAIMSNMGEHPRMCRMGGSPWKAHVLGLFYTGNSELSLTHETIMSIAGASIAYDVEQNNRMR